MSVLGAKFRRGLRNPGDAWGYVRARTRGRIFTVWCRIFHPRVQIGRRLLLGGRLKFKGPGALIIGDNVNIEMLVTPYTYSRDAVIWVGENVFLNGTRFGCNHRIEIGARSILGDCSVLDYDFHSVDPDHRNDPDYIRGSPVTIGENVWITGGCVVQKGAKIGCNSTIASCSVVRGAIPEWTIAGGNPAVVWKTLRREDAAATDAARQ